MKKKDVKLFNKAIHQVKSIVGNLAKDIKKAKLVVDELYELFDDLYNEKDKKNEISKKKI